MEIGRPGGATVERFFRLPFVKRDRIKDFLTSYEWLNGVLAEEVVGDSGALRGRVQTAHSGAGHKMAFRRSTKLHKECSFLPCSDG